MSTMILAFVFMLLMVAAMAVGVLMGRKPISGTCGGMKALGMDMDCEICGGNPALCDPDETPDATSGPVQKVDPGLIRNAGRK
ncbi:MAG: (Na+)-NQR maturation NqrM [Pseudomonadaceae bacterium]|nr:(Na+)-NQR maturation NqrM [Pseudomonadaceae bacterium]